MNTKAIVMTTFASACVAIGCVSVDLTRTQLASSNPEEVRKAEQNILRIAKEGRDTSGFVQFDINERIAYVNLVSNNALLLEIIDKSYEDKIVANAANRLDFTKSGLGMEILTKYDARNNIIEKVSKALGQGDSEQAAYAKKVNANRKGDSRKELPLAAGFAGKVIDSLTENELLQAISSSSVRYERRKDAKNRLISISQDPKVLDSVYDNEINDDEGREVIAVRLAALADNKTDKEIIVKALTTKKASSNDSALNLDEKKLLIARLPAQEAEKYALSVIDEVKDWEMIGDKNGMEELRAAIYVAAILKDRVRVERIVLAFGKKVSEGKSSGKGSMFARDRWSSKEDAKVVEMLKSVSLIDAAMVQALLAADDGAWTYCLTIASEDVAYDVLVSGKSVSDKMEAAFLKKLPKGRIDAKLYSGLRFESTRKLAQAEMSDQMRQEIASRREEKFKAICEKASAAAKETFELDGFYLGMSYDDLKVVFLHHFPNVEIKEVVDGEGKNADYVFYVASQKVPVCYADVKDKKVWQINLGKKLLKKWYSFDVQTPLEWAAAYSRATKIDMKFKLIDKDTTVYDAMSDRSYRVWFHQVSYQYRHNTKEYRLTYFGEEKDYTFEGGLGGDIIKSMAAPRFRYVRGDPGSLRVVVERD